MIQGMRDESAKKGNHQDETLEISFGAFEERHTQGEMLDRSSSAVFQCDSYTVFTSDAVVLIMVLYDSAKESRRSLDWVISHVNLPGEPIALSAEDSSEVPLSRMQGSNSSFMYELGKVLATFAIVVIIIAVIITRMVRRHQRDPQTRAESARRTAQYNNDDPY